MASIDSLPSIHGDTGDSTPPLRERLRFEMLLSDLSAKFVQIEPRNVYSEIKYAIEQVIKFFDLDRGLIAEFRDDDMLEVLCYYTRPGIEKPQLKIANDAVPWITKTLLSGQVINWSSYDDLPEEAALEYDYGKRIGNKSYLAVPIALQEKVICIFAFDSFRKSRTWSTDLIQRIRLLGEIFANALLRYRNEKELQKAFGKIKRLKKKIEAERDYLRHEIDLQHNYHEIIGKSEALNYVLFKIGQVAPTDTATLILGETGTGKELVARAIHNSSARKQSPLIKVNCAALQSTLIESELFGHEKGAFSGADHRRIGRFELANNGTLFLDEIGELPLDLQVKLLRVLQEGEFERLGSSRTKRVDVRIIAATNRNLGREVQAGRFRKDLWYRLNVYPLTLPPLSERQGDIPLLVQWFVEKHNKKLGKRITTISTKSMRMLESYSWPGNVRELENIIERSVVNTRGSVLNLSGMTPVATCDMAVPGSLAENERNHIIQAIKFAGGKIYGSDGAASILEIHPYTLRSRMKKLGIYESFARGEYSESAD